MNLIDLHTHTTASDGLCRPEELVTLALQRGLCLLAITDHDSTEGVPAALEAAEGTPLVVWPGVEVSTDFPQPSVSPAESLHRTDGPTAEVHLLGYLVDYRDAQFQATLRRLRSARHERGQKTVARLAEMGMGLDWNRVLELAGGGAVGRPHIAHALVEKGYVRSWREAFNLYLRHGGPAYVERFKLTPVEAVRLIVGAGGLPVLAHPALAGQADLPYLEALLAPLVDAGLVGIEAYYPDYEPATTQQLVRLADRLGLIPTGGSDFHGGDGYLGELGQVYVPPTAVERLCEAAVARGAVRRRAG